MTTYVTATLAAARNDELHRRGAYPLPLWSLEAIASGRRPNAIKRYFRTHASHAQVQPIRGQGFRPRRV
jgi:hypothetical protein